MDAIAEHHYPHDRDEADREAAALRGSGRAQRPSQTACQPALRTDRAPRTDRRESGADAEGASARELAGKPSILVVDNCGTGHHARFGRRSLGCSQLQPRADQWRPSKASKSRLHRDVLRHFHVSQPWQAAPRAGAPWASRRARPRVRRHTVVLFVAVTHSDRTVRNQGSFGDIQRRNDEVENPYTIGFCDTTRNAVRRAIWDFKTAASRGIFR